MKRAGIDNNGGSGTTTRLDLSLNHACTGGLVGVCLEFQNLSLKGHHLKQIIDSLPGVRGNLTNHGLPAPILSHKPLVL